MFKNAMPKTQTSNCKRFNALEVPDKADQSKARISDSLNKRCWFRKSTSLSANHCISRADKTYMACSVTGKSEARWKHETSMWSKLTYIYRNVCWFELQEIPPFNFKTSGNLMIRSKILMIKGQPGQPEAENWLGESSTGRTYTFRIRQLFW